MALGVDFGTTNSSVAYADPGGVVHSLKVRPGPNEPDDAVERSLVFDPLGAAPVVGIDAEGQEGISDERPLVASIKTRFDKTRLRRSAYQIESTATSQYDPVTQSIRIVTTGRRVPVMYDDYSLDEIVSSAGHVFERLLRSIDASGPGADVDFDAERLHVGVPVSFGPTARRRLLRSLAASGVFGSAPDAYADVLRRCRLVYEPLALATTLTVLEPQNVLVFDYGGGTLDLALLHVDPTKTPWHVQELALGGRPTAGDRLDELFRGYLLERNPGLKRSFDAQMKGTAADRFRARSAFSRAKRQLSTKRSMTMRLFGDTKVTRQDFEAAIATELDSVVLAVADTLARANTTASSVGTVLLTGGSSLIPAVQDRMRDLFRHLEDELAFNAGTPGDTTSELQALTGVSRGLALWGYNQTFEAGAPCTYTVVVPDTPATRTVCLERGVPETFALEDCPAVRTPVRAGRRSVVLMSDLLRETYCGAVVDLSLPSGEIEVRVSASRDRFAPAFLVSLPSGRELARFDLEAMSAPDLQRWVDGDAEWVPAERAHLESAFLTRPLVVGDFVEWRSNGHHRQGKVISIRDVSKDELVESMQGFDPDPYVFEVARELGGRVKLSQIVRTTRPWAIGDVRIA